MAFEIWLNSTCRPGFFWRHPDTETVVLRPCHILGQVKRTQQYLRLERPMTVIDPMVQVIPERDVVRAMHPALKPGVGDFNLKGPGELRLSQIFSRLSGPMAVPGRWPGPPSTVSGDCA